jgi:hypothetical protein
MEGATHIARNPTTPPVSSFATTATEAFSMKLPRSNLP